MFTQQPTWDWQVVSVRKNKKKKDLERVEQEIKKKMGVKWAEVRNQLLGAIKITGENNVGLG